MRASLNHRKARSTDSSEASRKPRAFICV